MNIVSLFDERVFTDAAAMLSHCKDVHHFDFLAVRDRLQLDFYGSIRLVNFSKPREPSQNLLREADTQVQFVAVSRQASRWARIFPRLTLTTKATSSPF